MKKNILSIVATTLAIIGTLAFKKNTLSTTYYWFLINSGESEAVGIPTGYSNYQVSFLKTASTITPGVSPCDETNYYQCIVGYTAGCVDKSGFSYILDTFGAPIVPQISPYGPTKYLYVRSEQ